MRRGLIVLGLALFLAVAGGAAPGDFMGRPGENLVYRIYVAGLSLAEQKLSVRESRTESGRPVLLLEAKLDTFRSVLNLIDYHEHRTIVFDPELGMPLEEHVQVTQRQESKEESFRFDIASGMAFMTKHRDGRTSTDSKPFTRGAQTGGTLIYHLRAFPWEYGRNRLPIFGHDGMEWYDYTVRVIPSHRVPFGKFDQVYHLVNKELAYEVWFDRGAGHLPIEIRSKLGFGVAQAKLTGATGYD